MLTVSPSGNKFLGCRMAYPIFFMFCRKRRFLCCCCCCWFFSASFLRTSLNFSGSFSRSPSITAFFIAFFLRAIFLHLTWARKTPKAIWVRGFKSGKRCSITCFNFSIFSLRTWSFRPFCIFRKLPRLRINAFPFRGLKSTCPSSTINSSSSFLGSAVTINSVPFTPNVPLPVCTSKGSFLPRIFAHKVPLSRTTFSTTERLVIS